MSTSPANPANERVLARGTDLAVAREPAILLTSMLLSHLRERLSIPLSPFRLPYEGHCKVQRIVPTSALAGLHG